MAVFDCAMEKALEGRSFPTLLEFDFPRSSKPNLTGRATRLNVRFISSVLR